VKLHITGTGTSYIFLLTALYVDNGENLPLGAVSLGHIFAGARRGWDTAYC
jgi:hypothetical protein